MGCGHGLLGVWAAINGAEHVVFQDYNRETLECATIPTARANGLNDRDKVTFVCGDWSKLSDNTCSVDRFSEKSVGFRRFDVIFSSETVYDPTSYPVIRSFLEKYLEPESGIALFAGKLYYFGVGGGTTSFQQYMATSVRVGTQQWQWQWQCVSLGHFEDGQSNSREVLALRLVRALE